MSYCRDGWSIYGGTRAAEFFSSKFYPQGTRSGRQSRVGSQQTKRRCRQRIRGSATSETRDQEPAGRGSWVSEWGTRRACLLRDVVVVKDPVAVLDYPCPEAQEPVSRPHAIRWAASMARGTRHGEIDSAATPEGAGATVARHHEALLQLQVATFRARSQQPLPGFKGLAAVTLARILDAAAPIRQTVVVPNTHRRLLFRACSFAVDPLLMHGLGAGPLAKERAGPWCGHGGARPASGMQSRHGMFRAAWGRRGVRFAPQIELSGVFSAGLSLVRIPPLLHPI